jgi:hypothetical protein
MAHVGNQKYRIFTGSDKARWADRGTMALAILESAIFIVLETGIVRLWQGRIS